MTSLVEHLMSYNKNRKLERALATDSRTPNLETHFKALFNLYIRGVETQQRATVHTRLNMLTER
jgi:hypothetical protein